jgi:Helix-turn-helix domain
MSVEAISWALNLAPVPSDSRGNPDGSCAAVLVGLANHAGPDGTGAFPSVKTLMRYTRKCERTVRTALDRLEAAKIIRPCDPAVVAAKVKRRDRRPQVWDLDMSLIRDDLDAEDLATLENQFPGLTARAAAARGTQPRDPGAHAPQGGTVDNEARGVQPLHPAHDTAVDNGVCEVQPLHPAGGAGCNGFHDGVQSFPGRGATAAPEPSIEPPGELSAATAGARGLDPVDNLLAWAADGIREFYAELGTRWALTARQRRRLAPAVAAALARGWDPQDLADFAGANTAGVRSPYAVLAARLSPGELPAPPGRRPSLPPWCGRCNNGTRRLEQADGADGGRCPRCHPLTPGPGSRGLPLTFDVPEADQSRLQVAVGPQPARLSDHCKWP